MSQPLVVTLPHRLGRDAAVRRLKDGLQMTRTKYGAFVSVEQEVWTGDDLAFRLSAIGQSASGTVKVSESDVTISVQLPWLLAPFAAKAQQVLQNQGRMLLERKK